LTYEGQVFQTMKRQSKCNKTLLVDEYLLQGEDDKTTTK